MERKRNGSKLEKIAGAYSGTTFPTTNPIRITLGVNLDLRVQKPLITASATERS
jgi:hypothetical protein